MHRLPVHDTARAAALRVVLGCEIEPRSHRDAQSGTGQAVWNITTACGEAGQLLESYTQGTLPTEHPFVAAMLGINAAAALQAWLSGRAVPVFHRHAGGRLVACTPGAVSDLTGGEMPAAVPVELRSPAETAKLEAAALAASFQSGRPFPFMAHHFAAAAIVAGCVPLQLTGTEQVPVLHLTGQSLTYPGLTLETLATVAVGGLGAPTALPGAEPAEHPFFYALEAVRTHAGFRFAENLTAKNPVHFFKAAGFGNPHTALVTEALLKSKERLPNTGRTFADHLRSHLAA